MKRVLLTAALVFIICCGNVSYGAEPRFEKVSDHCYYLQLEMSGENIAAIATDEGVLVVNPPQEPDLSLAVGALRRMTSKAVRWVVFTDHHFARADGIHFFAEQGAQLLTSARLRDLSKRIIIRTDSKDATIPESGTNNGILDALSAFPELIFDRQMNLFPSNLEIRILAIQPKARTGGDIVIHVPSEKVLFVGDLFETGRFPDIDTAYEGSALGWIEGLRQAINSVPLLKPAIPLQAKPELKSEPEKTLEERIAVVSARGRVANLQNMKDLLEVSQRLRNDILRAVRAGRTWDTFLASPISEPYRSYGNLASFAARLFEDLTAANRRIPANP